MALIVGLAWTLDHTVLFLVGAAGGLMSRLSRAVFRADVPTDYGASWTTLFLSPVVGALSAWAGVLLVGLAVKLQILGSAIPANWCDPYNPMVLAIALMLGFAERLFDEILKPVEKKFGGQGNTAQSGTPKGAANPQSGTQATPSVNPPATVPGASSTPTGGPEAKT
jgi:hypothetical protein